MFFCPQVLLCLALLPAPLCSLGYGVSLGEALSPGPMAHQQQYLGWIPDGSGGALLFLAAMG